MRKKYKIISTLVIFLIYSAIIYLKFPTSFEKAMAFAGIFIPIVLAILLSEESTPNRIPTLPPHTKSIILKINKTILEVKNSNFNKALQLIQSARININTHPTHLHIDRKTSIKILHLLNKIENPLLSQRNKTVKIKNDMQTDLLELKKIIELEDIEKNNRPLSGLTKTAIIVCIPLMLLSILMALYFRIINTTYLNFEFIISTFLFMYFLISFIGLLFNQKWAKTCIKIAFGFFMAIIILLLIIFGGDGFMSY